MSEESYKRQPAKRVLGAELIGADYHFKEEDREQAPQFLLLPSGGKANKVLVGGTITMVEDVSNDGDPYWRATVNDGTAEYTAYAGQYADNAARKFQEVANSEDMPPVFALMYGSTREYRPEDDEGTVYINVRPQSVVFVDRERRDQWLMETVKQTLDRINNQDGEYVEQAEDRYGDRVELLKDDLMDSLENLS